eukprot:227380_1
MCLKVGFLFFILLDIAVGFYESNFVNFVGTIGTDKCSDSSLEIEIDITWQFEKYQCTLNGAQTGSTISCHVDDSTLIDTYTAETYSIKIMTTINTPSSSVSFEDDTIGFDEFSILDDNGNIFNMSTFCVPLSSDLHWPPLFGDTDLIAGTRCDGFTAHPRLVDTVILGNSGDLSPGDYIIREA